MESNKYYKIGTLSKSDSNLQTLNVLVKSSDEQYETTTTLMCLRYSARLLKFLWANAQLTLTLQPVFQTVFHHHKELLQRRVVRVQRAAQVQRRLDQALDAQLGHVHQVEPLDGDGILRV